MSMAGREFGGYTVDELPRIVELVNAAYRGEDGKVGWTHELEVVDGLRTHQQLLEHELAEAPSARILTLREGERLLACVRLDLQAGAEGGPACYISMLAVHPALQDGGVGRLMLEHAESEARRQGARIARLTVLSVRQTLAEWYERRGYRRTGEREAFPYDDERFGKPLRADLDFMVLEKRL